jgi:phage baseplate assembly protein W
MTYYYNQKGVVSSRVIDIPFSFSPSGAVSYVDSQSAAAWRNKVITLLLTNRGSRVWYDRYGASLNDTLLFENMDSAVDLLRETVSEAFIRWAPEINLKDTLYNYDRNTGYLTVTVIYVTPDGTEDKVSLSQSSVTPSGDTLQVSWNG